MNTINTFKKITGGKNNTPEEVYEKFSWLKEASFEDSEVDISKDYLIWKNGVWEYGVWKDGIWEDGVWKNGVWKYGVWKDGIWEDGVWKYGVWENGIWEDGIWEGGTWEDGLWEDGEMWNNLTQKYVEVVRNKEKGIFEKI